MADIKITDLAAYTDPVSTDVLPIVDVGSDITKKVSIADLLENAGTGSAAAPSFSFDGDNNTGIYRPGADQVAISTSGTGRLFIDASGNVGVGYSTPGNFAGGDLGASRSLVVGDGTATTNVNIFSDSTGYGHLAFSDGTSGTSTYAGLIQYYHTSDSMALYTAATERMRIDSSGNVKLGTPSTTFANAKTLSNYLGIADNYKPGFMLKVPDLYSGEWSFYLDSASSATSFVIADDGAERLRIDSSGRVGIGLTNPSSEFHVKGAGTVATFEGTGGNGFIGLKDSDDSTIAFIGCDGGSLKFQTSGSSYSDKLVIDTSGNVGIGTTSPGQLLQVGPSNGEIRIGGGAGLDITHNNSGTTTAEIKQLYATTSANAQLKIISGFTSFHTGTSNTERARINSSGNVGIGTSSPDRKLHVRNDGAYALKVGGESAAEFYLELGQPGASASPGINYTGPSASLRFLNNGVDVARFDSSGNVGIGTTNPSLFGNSAKLVIQRAGSSESASCVIYGASNASSLIQFADGTGSAAERNAGFIAVNHTDQSMGFGIQDSERMRIDSSGNVGIGTSSPATALHVSGSGTQRIRITGIGAANAILALDAPSGYGNYIEYGVTASTPLRFYDVAATADRMIIDTSGRVGIGTTSPTGALEVVGTASEVARFRGNGASGGWAAWNSGGTSYGYIGPAALLASGTSTQFTIRSENELLFTSGGGTERARIDSSGRVGIGTTSPSQPLDVVGWVKTSVGLLGTTGRVSTASGGINISTGATANPIIFTGGTGGANVERMRIDSSGRLLVGTSSDSGGALLQVNDNRIRIATAKTPASASDTGTAGEICWDADYIYVCTATDTWKRTAISTW